jgi:hypothetical protein
MLGALSDERTGLPFAIAAGPCRRSNSWVRVPSRLPKLEGQVRVFVFPRNRMAQLYPQALAELQVLFSLHSLRLDHTQKTQFY